METQLKRLCDLIFKDFKQQLLELRVYPRAFNRGETQDTLNQEFEFCESYFIGLKFSSRNEGSVDMRPTISGFCMILEMNRINKQINNLRIMHYTREQLSHSLVQNF